MIKTKKNIIVVIPARKGSQGLKNKNLKKIKSKSLVEICIETAKKVKLINFIAVSTDSKKIQVISKKKNVWCEKLRPKNISLKNSQTNLAILHALNNIKKKFDYIIELQPTYLFRKPETIKKAIHKLINNKEYDSLISIVKIQNTAHPEYVIQKKIDLLRFKKSATKFNRHYLKEYYQPIGLILMTKYEKFIKTHDMLNGNIVGIDITSKKEAHDINDYFDLKVARNY